MIGKPIDKIEEQDLQSLRENKLAESKTLEYKQALPGNSEGDKKEFLADVSSFANAEGGDLIYGITENPDTREPQTIQGFDVNDETKSRLENIIRDGISPRIIGHQIQPIPLKNGKSVIIIRIPQSWNKPHRVIYGSHDKFYTRSSNGKYPMDVGELRTAFTLSETIAEKIKRFRDERISNILMGNTSVNLGNLGKVVMHFIPFTSFQPGRMYDLNSIVSNRQAINILEYAPTGNRFLIDGYITFAVNNENKGAYVIFYRNGIIEFVDSYSLTFVPQTIRAIPFERMLLEQTKKALDVIKTLNVDLPIILSTTLLGVKGYKLNRGNSFVEPYGEPIDRDIINLPEVVVDDSNATSDAILQPCLDALWNSSGFPKDLFYDDNGKWTQPR